MLQGIVSSKWMSLLFPSNRPLLSSFRILHIHLQCFYLKHVADKV